METIGLAEPRVLVLIEGDSPASIANGAGHLFEQFVGRLLERYGYEAPSTENVNVTARGIEIDLSVRHALTAQPALVECKAYSSPVSAALLDQFFGKLTISRFTEPETQGFFVALPRLTASGKEQADTITAKDPRFRVLTAADVVDALRQAKIIGGLPVEGLVTSDPAVVITEHGVYSAVIELDPVLRTATRVLAWSKTALVPKPVLELISSDSDYGAGIEVVDISVAAEPSPGAPRSPEPEPVIATVTGSADDFEYQLPASPRFFVGRSSLLAELGELVSHPSGVVVLNAQSGWGKSSLALRLKKLVEDQADGYALLVDTRTATNRTYLTAVLRRAALEAQERGLLRLRTDPSWATLAGSLKTLSSASWDPSRGPLMVFFDQFENVFKETALTREFRDLALGCREVNGKFMVGFAWKTDLVGWTEGHPYQLRDEIRANAQVFVLEPLGAREVETLLRRLEKKLGQSLLPDLRRRLREYSQGLPWLLKKLAGHVIREVGGGATQEKLLAEALNVQNLFEADLAELQPLEHEAIRFIARFAPVPATEAMERFQAHVVQSLLDRRLVVQVGERLDTYWDTFRDFLNTGRVPIEDSYILRQSPTSVARLIAALGADGEAAVNEIAADLKTSENAVYNLSRELRLMGVTAYEPNRVRVSPEVWDVSDREDALRKRIAGALRRHRAFTSFTHLAERSNAGVDLAMFARELPSTFPAVEVSDHTWLSYARVFVLWFEYAGLVKLDGQLATPAQEGEELEGPALIGRRPRVRVRGVVGQRPPGLTVRILLDIANRRPMEGHQRSIREHMSDLVQLGAVQIDQGEANISKPELVRNGQVDPAVLRSLLEQQPGFSEGFRLLEEDSSSGPLILGGVLAAALGAEWAEGTLSANGKHVRAWARFAGIKTSQRRQESDELQGPISPGPVQDRLDGFADEEVSRS